MPDKVPQGISDRALPGPTPCVEVLYRSERTVVSRLTDPAAASSTIRKELLGPEAQARLRHETRILERLVGLADVSQLLSIGPGTAFVLRDASATSLADACTDQNSAKPLPAAALIDLAMRLARILAEVHRRGVLHLDIAPENILHGGADGVLELIDFQHATIAGEERRGLTHHSEIAGTLAYIAPELTGRMGRAIDHRADLYAFGATLYQLATGAPPFGQGDPLQLIRDHIATVPTPPVALAADLPALLSDIILRLLEKEPDHRYQSADGLADDLERLYVMLARGDPADSGTAGASFTLGLSDFPLRLVAPSRLIGRSAELTVLRAAFADARAGHCRLLLVEGAAGVGKTALIDQLRPITAAAGGWLVAARFEPYHDEGAETAALQVLGGIVALLLAEPEDALADMRARLHGWLGEDLGVLAAIIPGMADLTGPTEMPANVTEARTRAAALTFLQAVISPARPMVIALDDLQWAPPNSLQQITDALTVEAFPGLLLVGAYRGDEVDDAHPLTAVLRRWQRAGVVPRRLQLANLAPAGLAEMLGEVLRLPPAAARPLAEAVGARTAGNPFETLELLNELRRENTLTRGPQGWQWDRGEIRRHVGLWEMTETLRARVAALPAATQEMLANMACLGTDPATAMLTAASASTDEAVETALLPALEDGLVVLERGGPGTKAVVRFRNHRVQQSVYGGMDAAARQARHLTLARRLAPHAPYAQAAAEQYLPAMPALLPPEETSRAATLFAAAAARAERVFRHGLAESYYGAAIALQEASPQPDATALTLLRTTRLTALYNLGRHDEADRLFQVIGQAGSDPRVLAEASCVQVLSLTNRGRHAQAVAIGMAMLQRLGIHPPATDLAAAVAAGLARLPAWLSADAAISDADRVSTSDPLICAAARLINRVLPAAQLLDPLTGAWLALENQRLWATHGICPEVVASLARSAAAPNLFGGDYRTGYEMGRHAIAVGTACGYEPETSMARQNFATFAVHWFERLENTLDQVAAARVGLIQAGEIQAVCINYISSLAALFDCAPTLESYGAEIATALEFTARTGNDRLFESFHNHLLLLHCVNGTVDAASCLTEAPADCMTGKPFGLFSFHCAHAIMAALFDDEASLARYSVAAMTLINGIGGGYRTSIAVSLLAVSIARQARRPDVNETVSPPVDLDRVGPDRIVTLGAEFDALRAWLAARAADAPGNFEHLLHFIDAEAAWTQADLPASIRAFNHALQCCVGQARPWHHALIAERAGLFHLAHGLEYVGRGLLRDALRRYTAWGATAVVRRLSAAHGFLSASDGRPAEAADIRPAVSSDAMDLMAILRASQALSSQTTIGGLQTRVVETLAAMTGATACHLVIWDDARQAWCLSHPGDEAAEPIEAAAERGMLPLSAFRYVERTRTPLLVDDAKLDDRFSRDGYFAGLARCSLLVLPVQSQGASRAVLMLENRLSRGVFSHARLNVVTLVASQLAVSLDNAQLYASLERRVAERTEALAVANQRLAALSISDGLTGLANRRHFDDVIQTEWLRGLRAQTSIGLVIVDIDHFKRFNDFYGHLGGDACLRTVALALQSSVRQDVDLASRYGGEEFVLVLPGADARLAELVAKRAHAAVSSLRLRHAGSAFGHVTVSAGVAAAVPTAGSSAEQLIAAADAALYRAKQRGRNCVEPASAAQDVASALCV